MSPTSTPVAPGATRVRREADMLSDLEIAQRLLADETIRSVTIDSAAAEATLRYADRRVDHTALDGLSQRLGMAAAALRADEVEVWPNESTNRENYVRAPQQATGWRRWMHLTLAATWFVLAVLGAILPGLPCTGFLLLCSYSLCRSSKRLHKKLLDSKWFGPMLRHWRIHRGVRPGVKTKALGSLVLMVGVSLAYAPLPTPAWWAVAVAGAIGAACILRLRVVDA